MPRAFWMFSANAGDGSEGNENRPSLPSVGGKWTMPGDVIRLTGPAGPNAHRHLLVGGVALADDNLGDGHVHDVVLSGEQYVQVTVGAVNHTHALNTGAGSRLVPDYYLLFWAGSNADAVAIAGDSDCYPVVEAEMTQGEDGGWSIGDLKGGWATQDTTWWRTKMLDILGVQMPAEVTNGRRLIRLFLGALLSRQSGDERGYRFG